MSEKIVDYTRKQSKRKESLKNYCRDVFSKVCHRLKACTLEVEAINGIHRISC